MKLPKFVAFISALLAGRFEGGDDLSGAYLFLPDGPARSLLSRNAYQYVVLEGSMLKKVKMIY